MALLEEPRRQSGIWLKSVTVTCPSCFEDFEVAAPHPHEVPADVDYDCEVCCNPMRISFWLSDEDVVGAARGLDD